MFFIEKVGGGIVLLGKDLIFVSAVCMLCAFHVDYWAWGRSGPLLFGWIPYHLWYCGLLTVTGSVFFAWWAMKMWPEPGENGRD